MVMGLMVLLAVSCKSKQAVLSEGAAASAKAAKEIIKGHYKNEKDFSTLYIRASVKYDDPHTGQRLSADVRIKKDEKILVSVKFLGITMAKALITPDEVSYYEKINGTYFQGNYAMLSQWLGAELDFNKVQNMLIGKALYNLKDDTYTAQVENSLYKLQDNSNGISKTFFFEGSNYLLKREIISQGGIDARRLDIKYPSHSEYDKAILPSIITIEAEQKDKVTINIEYNTVTFDEDFSFPYSVPAGYEQVFLN